MDKNQQTTSKVQTASGPGEQPEQTVQPEVTSKTNTKLIVAGVVVLLILVVGVIVWYTTQAPSYTETRTGAGQVSAPKSLEAQLNEITIEDLERDFADVDRDLQSL